MATRRSPGTLPPRLTPEREALAVQYHWIAAKVASYYVRRAPAGLVADDLLGSAQEALTMALARADLSNKGLEDYLWECVKGAVKDLIRRKAIELGGTSHRPSDASTERMLEGASTAFRAFTRALEDPGNVWEDTRAVAIENVHGVVGDAVMVLTLGSGGALEDMRGDTAMVLRLDLERARKAVRALVAELPPVLRVVTELRWLKGCEIAEVAQQTGMPEPTVTRRLKRAFALLKARLLAKGITGLPEPE